MRKRIIIPILVALAAVTAGGYFLWTASIPVLFASTRTMSGKAFDGDADTYRELGGFTVTRWKYRQWSNERDFIALTGCVVADQPHTKVSVGGVRSSSNKSSVVWTAQIGVVDEDSQTVIPKLSIEIEYDLVNRTATLLNTGEVHPFSEDKVFTVYVNGQFDVDRFVALDPDETLTNVHLKLAESFAAVMASRDEIAEPTTGDDG